jgi:hypothetical protein
VEHERNSHDNAAQQNAFRLGALRNGMTTTPSPVSTGAARARRYRQRRKNGVRCVRIRLSEQAIAALVEDGFLPRDKRDNDAIERAFYGLLNAARRAGVTARDA